MHPAPCTLNSIPHSDTYVHTAMHRFIPMTPAQSGHARICAYAHTYAHSAKGWLDPPHTTLQFTHALHTATSTSAITPTKMICAASSAYQIPRAIHTSRSETLLSQLREYTHSKNCTIFTVSVRKVSVQACAKFHCERVQRI